MKTKNFENKLSKKALKLKVDKSLKELAEFELSGIEKVKVDTKYYVCNEIDEAILLNVWVVNPNLVVSEFATLNNAPVDLNRLPVSLGRNSFLKGKQIILKSVGSSIENNVTFSLNTSVTGGYKNEIYCISLSLEKGETGIIILKINFI